ncbi:MAG: lysophospholipase L1-like esterase [Bacteroidia bacterium]|jgi:lysophospholipase L1-like esterase
MKFNRIYILLLAFAGFACEPDLIDERVKPSSGDADFSNYVAVGNSLTAGYADGGLYLEAQQQSYPSILASKFSLAGGGEFKQPLTTENGIEGYLSIASFSSTGTPNITRITPGAFDPATGGPFNNIGVPGIRVLDIDIAGYGNPAANPYFARILLGTGQALTTTYLDVVTASNPTFFTNWMGNNDVLGYATSGGIEEGTGSPAGSYIGAITPVAAFEFKYKALITALTANGAKGAVATIPNVTDIPYFTTAANLLRGNGVPLDSFPLSPQLAGGLNAIYAANGYTWDGEPFVAGMNTFAVVTQGKVVKKLDPENDLILLPITAIAGQFATGLGTGVAATFSAKPIPDQFVLDAEEVARAKKAVSAYNNIIKAEARNKGLALWDANAFFADFVKNGFVTSNVTLSASFISGGAFSLDGVHATPRGYALVAQKFLDAIEAKYSTVLPEVRIQEYRTVNLP